MEPDSPTSEINQDEFFDALQTQKLQHARHGSRSTIITTASSSANAASLFDRHSQIAQRYQLQQQQQQQHQQQSQSSAQAARLGPTLQQSAEQYFHPIVPGTWPLAPRNELVTSPTPSLTRHNQTQETQLQSTSERFAQEESVDRYSGLEHQRSIRDVSQQHLCDDAPLHVTETTPLEHGTTARVSSQQRQHRTPRATVTDVEASDVAQHDSATRAVHDHPGSASSSSIDETDHYSTRPRHTAAERLRPLAPFRDMGGTQNEDLFLEVADDAHNEAASTIEGRTSWRDKRRSLPPSDFRALTAMETRRPRTSGGPSAARPGTRLDEIRSGLRYRQSDHGSALHDDATSLASYSALNDSVTIRPRRGSRYSGADKQTSSPLSPSLRREGVRSPDMSIFGRNRPFQSAHTASRQRRPSQLAAVRQESEGDSPAESSEPKQSQPESVSAESQTAPSTVWDELDDLKSRIKKLELTGKLPSTSAAAVGSPQLERPRTATTAPTTIDSSPKRDKKAGGEPEQIVQTAMQQQQQQQQPPATPTDSHPLLHAALAKAKALLNPGLYRSLEATAADALQLASIAGASGPGMSSTASVVNGGSSADRALRRKADSMCRNLTELCLALCDGKHEASSSTTASPLTLNISKAISPSGRLSRMSAARGEVGRSDSRQQTIGNRPMSRLEARRSSILGSSPTNSPRIQVTSQRDGEDGASASEHDSTLSQPNAFDRQRYVRSSSRLTAPHSRYEDVSGDEDPTLRPPSRVGSEFSFRSKRTLDTQNVPSTHTPHRSFSLREALSNRRSSSGQGQGVDGHRELARVASMTSDSGRRRWMRESTPPVLEEDIDEQEGEQTQTPSQPQPKQSRLASLGQMKLASRRVFTDASPHGLSVNKRSRRVAVE